MRQQTRNLLLFILLIPALLMLGYLAYAVTQIAAYNKIAASPYESEAHQVAYAFAYNLDRQDYDGATAYYDYYGSPSEADLTIQDLKTAVGLDPDCKLLKKGNQNLEVEERPGVYAVKIPYLCAGQEQTHTIYVTDGHWPTPNGAGKFVVSEAAGQAGKPLT